MIKNHSNHTIVHSRYQLQDQLGQGAMGEVYQALDLLTGERVAFKRVSRLAEKNLAGQSPNVAGDLRLALTHECQIMAGLRHPHIISVLVV